MSEWLLLNVQVSNISAILYTHKYLESDLIKHCHGIFIHSLGQPLIARSHSKVHLSRGNPKEIPTWASRVSNYGICRKAAGILLVSDAKIFDIIYLVGVWPDGLSPLEKLGHPSLSGRKTVGSHSNKGDNCIRLSESCVEPQWQIHAS